MTTFAESGLVRLADLFDHDGIPVVPGPGGTTRSVPYQRRPVLRRSWSKTGSRPTGEQPLFPTGAELAVWGDQWGAHAVAPFQEPPVGTPPTIPPQPPAPRPSWAAPAGHYPPIEPPPSGGEPPKPGPKPPVMLAFRGKQYPVTEKPLLRRGQRRRDLPTWVLLVCCFASGLAGCITGLAIAWQVAQ